MFYKLNYNIHDFLSYQIVKKKPTIIKRDVDIEHDFFRTDKINKPDIELRVGNFVPSKEDCFFVDNKYYIKENYFYCIDGSNGKEWAIEIKGFDYGQTQININFRDIGIRNFLPIITLHNLFLLPLIHYKLSTKNIFLIHSSGVNNNNSGYLFSGLGGAFKTTIVMDLTRKHGYSFLGDERIILKNKEVYSFPISLLSFDYRRNNLQTENKFFSDNVGLINHFLKNYNNYDGIQTQVSMNVPIKSFCFITRNQSANKISFEKISKKNIVRKLINNEKIEIRHANSPNLKGVSMNPFEEYRMAYSFVYPESRHGSFWQDMEEGLYRSFAESKSKNFSIKIPYNYSENITEEIKNFIEHSSN